MGRPLGPNREPTEDVVLRRMVRASRPLLVVAVVVAGYLLDLETDAVRTTW